MKRIKTFLEKDLNLSILVGLTTIVLVIAAAAFGSSMYSARNIQSMAFQIPEFGFLALAMMLSNMIGGIDLSIIANANTVAIFTAYVLNGSLGIWNARTGKNCVGTACCTLHEPGIWDLEWIDCGKNIGTVSGSNTWHHDIDPGNWYGNHGGASIGDIDPAFSGFGKAVFLGLPVIFWLFLVVALVLGLVLSLTEFGRKLYLYGGESGSGKVQCLS